MTATVFSARTLSRPMSGPKYGLVAALLTKMSTAPKRSIEASTQSRA